MLTPLAWAFLFYNVLVVVWGALVRATGSGAGCGSHWPLCNDEWIPQHPQFHTLIELTHRGMSGAALVGVVAFWAWSRRRFPRGHLARQAAGAALFFMVLEAALGAGLVLLKLVEHDASLLRAGYLSIHLINTFLLLAALTLLAWASSRPALVKSRWRLPQSGLWGMAVIGLLGVGMLGGLAALGDTLFPAASLHEGWASDWAAASHLLLRIRIFHPLLAVLVGTYVITLAWMQRPAAPGAARASADALMAAVLAQWGIGLLDLIRLAPVGLQLLHLLTADLTWIALVLCIANRLETPA